MQGGGHDQQIVGFLAPLLSNANGGRCSAFGLVEYHDLLNSLLENPLIAGDTSMVGAIHFFSGHAHYDAGEIDAAVEAFDRSFAAAPEIDVRIQQVVWLLEARDADAARKYLNEAEAYLSNRRWTRRVLDNDIAVLRERVARLGSTAP